MHPAPSVSSIWSGRGRARGRAMKTTEVEIRPGKKVNTALDPISPTLAPTLVPAETQIPVLVPGAAFTPLDESDINAIAVLLEDMNTSEDILKACIEDLANNCFEDWSFASRAVGVCLSAEASRGDNAIRHALLRLLQFHTKNKDHYRWENRSKWLGYVSLMMESTKRLLSPGGKPFNILITTSMDNLENCLKPYAFNEELNCAAHLLSDLDLLYEHGDKKMFESLSLAIQAMVCRQSVPASIRYELLGKNKDYSDYINIRDPSK